eukprot:3062978-Prymnesium_polylepis.1
MAHTAMRGHDAEHVNYVTVVPGGTEDPESFSNNEGVMATLLNSKRVVRIRENQATNQIELIAQLDAATPPHEGFIAAVPWDPRQPLLWNPTVPRQPLLWNSTVDGRVLAFDPVSGLEVQRWNLSENADLPRGWTRGLCLLHDGFLVGSTAIHKGSEKWIAGHGNTWNFDAAKSRTTVSFIPFASSSPRHEGSDASADAGPKSVHLLNSRRAKIFSLLLTPGKELAPVSADSLPLASGQQLRVVAFFCPDTGLTPCDMRTRGGPLANFWPLPTPIVLRRKGARGQFSNSEAAYQSLKWWQHDSTRA